jgi:hypothetical protein
MDYKLAIRNAEQRVSDYNKMIKEVSINKVAYNPTDDLIIWYKSHLRESKNQEQIWLKKIIEEWTWLKDGLDPPNEFQKTFMKKHN